MNGVFFELRSQGINLSDDSYVSVHSNDFYTGATFCGSSNVSGSPAQVLIDGKENTAWANMNSIEENQRITISFRRHSLFLYNFSFQTLCSPPKSFKLEGSNDLISWLPVHNHSAELNTNFIRSYSSQYPGRYRYFKITQVGTNINGGYRFHLHNIDFFGELVETSTCSCEENLLHISIIFLCIHIILIFK